MAEHNTRAAAAETQSGSNNIISLRLGSFETAVSNALAEMEKEKIIPRFWNRDFTLWKPEPREIVNRLGWLTSAEKMEENLRAMRETARSVRAEGFTRTVLLGMGGSSLAPEVLAKLFGAKDGCPKLTVLDTTNPDTILACAEDLDLSHTLFIVSTKSGDTVETASLFKFFYRRVCDRLGEANAGKHFIAITDRGSKLEAYALRLQFRNIFLNDPEIGGRYSALSYFGLLPAALSGIEVERLLESARLAMGHCNASVPVAINPAARLGAALGELALAGRDKLTFLLPSSLAGFGDWLEQLIAESTGKEGKGILPVVGESIPENPAVALLVYGKDRVFVNIRTRDEHYYDVLSSQLAAEGHPVLDIVWDDPYEIGYHFFLWEAATALASIKLRINPFDQPNVESAKVLAREMIAEFMENCTLPSETPVAARNGVYVYGGASAASPEEALISFLRQAHPGDYVSIQAFLPYSKQTDDALLGLRARILNRCRVAVTAGYGPRYLHSTGQLHKGDRGNGLFIRFTADISQDAAIPDEPDAGSSFVSFGILNTAQALGDKKALLAAGRRVLHFHLGSDITAALNYLMQAIKE